MELKIPVEIVFDDVNSVIDELGKLQKYKLGKGDDMTLVDVDDVADVLTRHVKAREAKEPSVDAVPQWIPCSERLPNEDEDVIVSIKGIGVRIGYLESYCMGGEWCQRWWWEDECFDDDEFELVEAWMPLPKPYERKEE